MRIFLGVALGLLVVALGMGLPLFNMDKEVCSSWTMSLSVWGNIREIFQEQAMDQSSLLCAS